MRKPFEKGNPYIHNGKQGRPKGSRNKLASAVFQDMLAHWTEPCAPGCDKTKGQECLETIYRERPLDYAKLTASVLPRELILDTPVSDLSDDETDRLLDLLLKGEPLILDMKPVEALPNVEAVSSAGQKESSDCGA